MRIIDNVIALRILWLLITPFKKTEAYKLGLIDGSGTRIKKAKTSEETNATSMLHRLVWNIKKFINLVPGGSTKIGSIVAAYALVRECRERTDYIPSTESLTESYSRINLTDDTEIVEAISMLEDMAANVTGTNVSTDVATSKKKIKVIKVTKASFNNFKDGVTKGRRVSTLLNMESTDDQEVFRVLSQTTGGILAIVNEGNIKLVKWGVPSLNSGIRAINVVENYLRGTEYSFEVATL